MTKEHITIRLNPHLFRLIPMIIGLSAGVLIVVLDPWLRFDGIPIYVNWREALLTGVMMGGYGFLLGWLITEFWGSAVLWLMALLTAPLVGAILALWNEVTTVFGATEDVILALPLVIIVHGALLLITILYLQLVKRIPGRRIFPYMVIPLLMIVLTAGIGWARWEDRQAKDIMKMVNDYASVTVGQDYTIEYLGIRYRRSGLASEGNARIHSGDQQWLCRVGIYLNRMEINCNIEEEK